MTVGGRIAIVGAGPKALALAAKAQVLQDLKRMDVNLDVFEENSIAVNWTGQQGFTDGKQILGTPPEKDVGFPYKSSFGPDVDRELSRFSWNNYLIRQGLYSSYIDRGKPHPSHLEWAKYLRWVAGQLQLQPRMEAVTEIALNADRRFVLSTSRSSDKLGPYDGVVVTGPGPPYKVADSNHQWTDDIMDGRLFWKRLAVFQSMTTGRVAIIGAGETAASIAVALANHAPNVSVEIINRHGTLYTRGESFHENTLYTHAQGWPQLDEEERLDFIRRTDRGVFSVESKKRIDHADNINVVTGSVKDIEIVDGAVRLEIERNNKKRMREYAKVIVAIGFDALWALDLLAPALKEGLPVDHRGHRRRTFGARVARLVDYHFRVPVPLATDAGALCANFHIPMLSGLTQGPGFPNLSCLGSLSDRILSAYQGTSEANKWFCREVSPEGR